MSSDTPINQHSRGQRRQRSNDRSKNSANIDCERMNWEVFLPADDQSMVDLVGCRLTTEVEAREFISAAISLIAAIGWDDTLFLSSKGLTFRLDVNAALFCRVQEVRSRMKSWQDGTFANLDPAKTLDISDRRNLKRLLSPDTTPEAISIAEWLRWKFIHSNWNSNRKWFAMIMTRTAMSSAIIRFMRLTFDVIEDYTPTNADEFKERYSQLASFARYHRQKVKLQNGEIDMIRNAVTGTFLHLGDVHSLSRFHPDYSTAMPTMVVADIMLSAAKLNEWKSRCGTLTFTAEAVEKELKGLPDMPRDVAILMYVFQYVYSVTGNRIEMGNHTVLWHEWMSRQVLARLMDTPASGLPKTPVICCMGTDSFWLVYHDRKSYLASNSIHALTIWLDIVLNKQNGQLDDTSMMAQLPPKDFILSLKQTKNNVDVLLQLEKERRSKNATDEITDLALEPKETKTATDQEPERKAVTPRPDMSERDNRQVSASFVPHAVDPVTGEMQPVAVQAPNALTPSSQTTPRGSSNTLSFRRVN